MSVEMCSVVRDRYQKINGKGDTRIGMSKAGSET